MIEVNKKMFVGSFTKPQLRASHQKICFFFSNTIYVVSQKYEKGNFFQNHIKLKGIK
jgi:hypothetical protein